MIKIFDLLKEITQTGNIEIINTDYGTGYYDDSQNEFIEQDINYKPVVVIVDEINPGELNIQFGSFPIENGQATLPKSKQDFSNIETNQKYANKKILTIYNIFEKQILPLLDSGKINTISYNSVGTPQERQYRDDLYKRIVELINSKRGNKPHLKINNYSYGSEITI
jgi:hypothetical protein